MAVVFITVIIIAGIGYYFWNKPHRDVAGASGIKTNAAALYKAFTTDSAAANKNFIEQVIEVSGMVSSVSKNQQNQTIILIKTTTESAYINCTMEQQSVDIKEANNINIKGICNGLGDAELGIMGDVYLVRCYLVK